MSDSGFFTSPDIRHKDITSQPELIHESQDGWSQLYLVDKDGRFRIYKALKEEFRCEVKYETLLRKEFEIGYKMSHPCICEVYGFLEIEDFGNVIEMEWIDGVTLGEFLHRGKPSKSLSKSLILQLCDAVSYCHSRQIIHRDIKPENIMITHTGNRLKLLDFGLSDSESHSVFKSACGTTSFAAPEVIDGGPPDELSDIYSLGKVISLLHPAFGSIARKCMRKDKNRRYPDVVSVRSAVMHLTHKRVLVCFGILALLAAVASAGLARFVGGTEAPQDSITLPVEEVDTEMFVATEPQAPSRQIEALEPVPATILPVKEMPSEKPPKAQPIPSVQQTEHQSDTQTVDSNVNTEIIDRLFEMTTKMVGKDQ